MRLPRRGPKSRLDKANRCSYDPSVTFLVNPPAPIEVRTDATGRPCYLRGDPLVGDLQVVSRWVVDVDWWDRPVSREYWRVILRERLLCEIYRDRDQQAWFVERIYD